MTRAAQSTGNHDSMEAAVRRYLAAVDWSKAEEEPLEKALLMLARQLDTKYVAATMAQFIQTFAQVTKSRPYTGGPERSVERMLKSL